MILIINNIIIIIIILIIIIIIIIITIIIILIIIMLFRFVGACIDPGQTFLITEYCPRGSLQVEPQLKEAGVVFKVKPLERSRFA